MSGASFLNEIMAQASAAAEKHRQQQNGTDNENASGTGQSIPVEIARPGSQTSASGNRSGSGGVNFGNLDNAALMEEGIEGYKQTVTEMPILLQGLNVASEQFHRDQQSVRDATTRAQSSGDQTVSATRRSADATAAENIARAEREVDVNSAHAQTLQNRREDLQELSNMRTLDEQNAFSTNAALSFRKPVYVEDANGNKTIKKDANGNYVTEEMGTGQKILTLLFRNRYKQANDYYTGRVAQNTQTRAVLTQSMNQLNTFIAAEAEKTTGEILSYEKESELADAQLTSAASAFERDRIGAGMLIEIAGLQQATVDIAQKALGANIQSADQYMRLAEFGKSVEWYQLQSNQYSNNQDALAAMTQSWEEYKEYSGLNLDPSVNARAAQSGNFELIDPTVLNGWRKFNAGMVGTSNPDNIALQLTGQLEAKFADSGVQQRNANDIVDTAYQQTVQPLIEKLEAERDPQMTTEEFENFKAETLQAAGLGSSRQFLNQAVVNPDYQATLNQARDSLQADPVSYTEAHDEYSLSMSQITDPDFGVEEASQLAMQKYGAEYFTESATTNPMLSKDETSRAFNKMLESLVRDRSATTQDINALVRGISQTTTHMQLAAGARLGIPNVEPSWNFELKIGRKSFGDVDFSDPEQLLNKVIQGRSMFPGGSGVSNQNYSWQ